MCIGLLSHVRYSPPPQTLDLKVSSSVLATAALSAELLSSPSSSGDPSRTVGNPIDSRFGQAERVTRAYVLTREMLSGSGGIGDGVLSLEGFGDALFETSGGGTVTGGCGKMSVVVAAGAGVGV